MSLCINRQLIHLAPGLTPERLVNGESTVDGNSGFISSLVLSRQDSFLASSLLSFDSSLLLLSCPPTAPFLPLLLFSSSLLLLSRPSTVPCFFSHILQIPCYFCLALQQFPVSSSLDLQQFPEGTVI